MVDYGLLAYLKATDLENRNFGSRTSFNVSVVEIDDVPSGESPVADIEGHGSVAVFISSTEKAEFYVDGIKNCEGTEVFFSVQEKGKITVKCDSEIKKIRLMVLGDIIAAEGYGRGYADYTDFKLAYLTISNSKAEAYITPIENFSPQKFFEGEYIDGDICAYKGNFVLALIDKRGDIYLKTSDGKSTSQNYKHAETISVRADGDELTLAYIREGKAYWFDLGSFDAFTAVENHIDFARKADDIVLEKNGKLAVISSGGNCYIRELCNKHKQRDKLYLKLEAEFK